MLNRRTAGNRAVFHVTAHDHTAGAVRPVGGGHGKNTLARINVEPGRIIKGALDMAAGVHLSTGRGEAGLDTVVLNVANEICVSRRGNLEMPREILYNDAIVRRRGEN